MRRHGVKEFLLLTDSHIFVYITSMLAITCETEIFHLSISSIYEYVNSKLCFLFVSVIYV